MEEKYQRLSEGYDFIEESTSFSNDALSFSDLSQIEISEGTSTKSPYKILGKACGCFAPIGEFSRNKRLYSDDLWPTVLENEEFKNRLESRSIFGCISHEDKLVDDYDIREGKVSHIVTKLEVREDLNNKPYLYGELEILDTPAGRILEAMYKGGANLYVSSRAAGKLIPVPGQNYSLVRPEQYHVHCFDVVCRPGFLQARPAFEAVDVEPIQHPVQEAKQEPIATVAVTTEAIPCTTANWAPITTSATTVALESSPLFAVSESAMKSEVAELKGQIDRLAQVIEKVVDDIYEENGEVSEEPQEAPEEPKAPVEEKPAKEETPAEEPSSETTNEELIPESVVEFIKLLAETNITDEAASDIFGMLFNKKEEN